jgi:predicted amidohydrolase YtcJ
MANPDDNERSSIGYGPHASNRPPAGYNGANAMAFPRGSCMSRCDHLRQPVTAGACALALLLTGCQEPAHEPATLAVTDARIWTGDPDRPWAEAIASRGETIVAVGSATEIESFVGPHTEVLSIAGSMVVPGMIDTHVHFLTGGAGIASVQLRDAATPTEFTRRIAEHAASLEPGEWILNGTWDHELWGGELPRRDWIDAVTPDNPVWVNRLDGHMALANSQALELAGVDADTPDVQGGEIVRDAEGNPTGILKDNAMALVERVVPEPRDAQLDRMLAAAMARVAANGVTSVHDMGGWRDLVAYRRAAARGELITRIYSVLPLGDWQRLRDEVAAHGRGDAWLRIGGLKGFMDGSLGSHTAAFLEPFSDAPDDRGFLINDLDDMEQWIGAADAAGLQLAVHAIGDRAIRELLGIFDRVAARNGDRDRRYRIEHAQHIHPDDLDRFAAEGVLASMQPYHAIDDGRWADRVIGPERARTTYAFHSLIESGAHVSFGSDWFVAPADPLQGIYAAVTRRTLDGAHPDGWVPEQKITVEQALEAYTVEAAYASFEEDSKGTLKPGMLADFVVLDRDITAIPPAEIRDTKVLKTVVGGRVVYPAN